MGFIRHQRARGVLIALALTLLAGWVLPSFLSAEGYRHGLEAGLERTLRRPVTFRAIHFRLLPRPGLEIENAVVREDPDFGSEPFARVDKIQCDLRWRSFWHSRLEFSELHLQRASFNFVRNERGNWNVEDFLLKSGIAAPAGNSTASVGASGLAPAVGFDDVRVNFKIGADKKSFALTELKGSVSVEPARRALQFNLAGKPVRADLSLPTPGVVELEGDWSPGHNLEGPLRAEIRIHRGLLYDWIPLVTGQNPEIYGVLDADLSLNGSVHLLKVEGEGSLSQIHRWEQIPPSNSLNCKLYLRAQVDRRQGHAQIDSLDASFADSRLHLSGSLDQLRTSPSLDLVVAVERSQMENLLALGHRLLGRSSPFGISGRVDGLVTIQGPWSGKRYGGFLSVQGARLTTPQGNFPVSELAVRIENGEARLAPATLTLAPRVELAAKGSLGPTAGALRYELDLSAQSVPLRDLVSLGRTMRLAVAQGLDAQGSATGTFRLAGSAWPPTRPLVTGRAEVRDARLLVAGLTEPLRIPHARIQLNDDQIVAYPVLATIGKSSFALRIAHRGERKEPWEFEVRANNLSLEQGALWFDALGLQRPRPLLERLPGLRSFAARRAAASDLFASLNARGSFASSTVTYRALTLKDFRTRVEIAGRVIHLPSATFRAGEARGHGEVELHFASGPVQIRGDVEVAHGSLRAFAPFLPDALRGVRGAFSGAAQFSTRALTPQEMSANLGGQAQVRLEGVSLGEFDPMEALVRNAKAGALERLRGETSFRLASAKLEVRDRRVTLKDCSLDLSGAKIVLNGTYDLNGALDLNVRADLRRLRRPWTSDDPAQSSAPEFVSLHLSGPIDKLATVQETPTLARRSPR